MRNILIWNCRINVEFRAQKFFIYRGISCPCAQSEPRGWRQEQLQSTDLGQERISPQFVFAKEIERVGERESEIESGWEREREWNVVRSAFIKRRKEK